MQQFLRVLFILVVAVFPGELYGQTVQLDAGKIAGVADTTRQLDFSIFKNWAPERYSCNFGPKRST